MPASPPIKLITLAAELRASGSSWDAVARGVGRSIETVRRWPLVYAELWRKTLQAAQRDVLAEVTAESVLTLRQQLRSEDKKASVEAAHKLLQMRIAFERKRPTRRKGKNNSKPDGLNLKEMSDDELDELLDRLIPAYLADRKRRERATDPSLPEVA